MYTSFAQFVIVIILVTIRINFIASLKPEFEKNRLKYNDLTKWRRNPGNKGSLSQINGVIRGGGETEESKGKNLTKSVNNSKEGNKISRIELLFGSSGIKLLNEANVLVLGANQLSSKVITHLIRCGVGSVTIWDENRNKVDELAREILVLNPDANIHILHTDPLEHMENNRYSTLIFSNQPLQLAVKYNEMLHGICNLVYATVAGTYGLVLNDFGNHEVNIRSDDSYPEHSCRMIHSGDQTCLEVDYTNDSFDYKKNEFIEVKYKKNFKNRGEEEWLEDIGSDRFKITNVVKSSKNSAKIWISTKNKKITDNIVSVRKVDEGQKLSFSPLESMIKSLLNPSIFSKLLELVLKKGKIRKLVISPGQGNEINNKSLSVLSSFIALSKTNQWKLDLESELDEHNFYNIAKEIYPNSDQNVVSNFTMLKKLQIPAINGLMGALVAQETIKGITKIFTPSEAIIVDRTDIFQEDKEKVDPEHVKYALEELTKLSFLIIGAGALGCDYLKILAEMGVKDVTVADNDTVDVSNLSRQLLFTINDIGKPKAQSALRNLGLLHNVRGYKHYNMMFSENTFERMMDNLEGKKNLVAISAVDNIEGRVALDNFCVQNRIPLIESGIYGMKCSTSFSVPHLTESFSSSMGDQALSDERYSCSVKGVPNNIEDCVFYAIELFAWIFNTEHIILKNFIKDPIKSLDQALETGSDYFYNLIQIVYENLKIINSQDIERRRHNIHIWAKRTYEKYFGYDSDLKEQLIENLSNLKSKSLKKVENENNDFDYNKFKSLVNQGFQIYDRSKYTKNQVPKNLFFEEMEKFTKAWGNNVNLEFQPLVLEEDCKDSKDFIYMVSNLRARKFNIPESDKITLVKKAKNIVPAVSTCVSIAASMSLLELYKLARLSKSNLTYNSFIEDLKSKNSGQYQVRNQECLTRDEIELSKRVTLLYSVTGSEIKFYNKDKLIFSLTTFDYSKHKHLSNLFNNYFFNTSTLNFVSNATDPPKLYKISSDKSILKGLSLSYWDYIIIRDQNLNLLKSSSIKNKFKLFDKFKGPKVDTSIYLYELVEILEFIFDVKVDALTHDKGYVLVNEENNYKPLKQLLNLESGDVILHLIARDSESDKLIELPDIKYSL